MREIKLQGFIFNWRGHDTNALALEHKIGTLIDVTVINSDEHLSNKHPEWIHLDDTAYFSAQWNKALELFDADVLFHIQADAEFDQFEMLIAKARLLFESHSIGVYEPNINYTSIQFDKLKLRSIAPDVYEVPITDCTCWFIAGKILRKLPSIDVAVNRYGWGIARAIAALCRLNGLSCVRDYGFTVRHPVSRGYSGVVAKQHMEAYVESFSPELKREFVQVSQLEQQLRDPLFNGRPSS